MHFQSSRKAFLPKIHHVNDVLQYIQATKSKKKEGFNHMNHDKIYTPEEIKEMEQAVENVDFTAVIARLAGKPLTEEQQKQCEKFDALYDQLHVSSSEDRD